MVSRLRPFSNPFFSESRRKHGFTRRTANPLNPQPLLSSPLVRGVAGGLWNLLAPAGRYVYSRAAWQNTALQRSAMWKGRGSVGNEGARKRDGFALQRSDMSIDGRHGKTLHSSGVPCGKDPKASGTRRRGSGMDLRSRGAICL